ncbi:MAG: thiopurine S-methyltransferase [Geothermobacteraceae bacterium]
MEPEFWQQIWQQNDIGFHRSSEHPALVRTWPRLAEGMEGSVFVPLCGKSLDLAWLAGQGREVIGVELSALAVDSFFRENSLTPQTSGADGFNLYRVDGLRIYQGDFFALSTRHLDGARLIYDRAALVAFPSDMRRRYAAHLDVLFPGPARMLLVANSYPEGQMDGPPFSVTADEVERLYAGNWRIERLERRETIDEHPGLRKRGLDSFISEVFLLEK